MKLDLGGTGKRNGVGGWHTVNCGSTAEWTDYFMDITSQEFDSTFPDGSVEYMLCSHTIEHLRCDQHPSALKLWRRKLTPTGKLEIICPDGLDIVQRFGRGEVAWLTVMNVLYGVPAWLEENKYNQHLYAFSFETLKELVESCGFRYSMRLKRDWEHNYANEIGLPYFGTFRVNDLHVIFDVA